MGERLARTDSKDGTFEFNILPLPDLQAMLMDLSLHVEELHTEVDRLRERIERLEGSKSKP